MRIGIDFDNTIVNYDRLFHKIAVAQGLIADTVPANKLAVRDYLRRHQQEAKWTAMQGYVYGECMQEAECYPHVTQVLRSMKEAGYELMIISHKTKYPFLGKPYDLHVAARNFVVASLRDERGALFTDQQVYLETSKEAKLMRIATQQCDVFIDDLPEILLANDFPKKTQRYLFDPESHYQKALLPHIKVVSSWPALASYLL